MLSGKLCGKVFYFSWVAKILLKSKVIDNLELKTRKVGIFVMAVGRK